ncbi:MAG: hypothetical protein ACXAC2_17465, partial [Candidatus Kariarchaeaceae archaeon]
MSIKDLHKHMKYLYSWGILFFLFFGIIGEISVIELFTPTVNSEENSQRYFSTPRLTSNQSLAYNASDYHTGHCTSIDNSFTISNRVHKESIVESSSSPLDLPLVKFGITENAELNITGITPRAMEKSAVTMEITINLTLGDIGYFFDVVENLTLTNGTNLPITDFTGWTELQDENGTYIDKYVLEISLNNSFLSSLALGEYDLVIYTNDTGYLSSDSISLPMRDLHVNIQSVSNGAEFNNKLDEDQYFLVDIKVQNETSVGNYSIDFLPISPTATVKSVTSVGFLQFEGFILNNTPQGEFALNYSMPAIVAQDFEDG